ncbi:MAG TPA: pseudouridine synthase, partial [Minicystis sp.]|nr:pseudouridine synthase [Minicystis sp.]
AREGGLVFADKPAAMPTTPERRGGRSLVSDVAELLGLEPAHVHADSRLDVGVSGVVVLCVDGEARKVARAAREAGLHRRVYVAIASGDVEGAATWEVPVGTVRVRGRDLPAAYGMNAQRAETRFAAIAKARGATLLRLEPVTGRSHQLRVHAQHAAAPLFGDKDHGGPRFAIEPSGRVVPIDRVALHALAVSLPGARGALVGATSPVPEELRAFWSALDGDDAAWSRVG